MTILTSPAGGPIHLGRKPRLFVSSGAAAPELPTFASLTGRWVANDLTGLVDDDPVTSFTDQSGNARHLTALLAEAGRRMLYKPNAANGNAALRSDGSNDAYTHAGLIANFVTRPAFTYWIVFRPNSLAASGGAAIYDREALLGVGTDGTWGVAITSDLGVQPFAGTGGSDFVPNLSAPEDVFSVLEVRQEGGTLYGRINNGTEQSVVAGDMFNTSGALILGSSYNGVASSDTDYAEVAISSAAESAGVRSQMRDYLIYTYGVG